MNLVAHDPKQPIDICGYSIPAPSCVIHFYYSAEERRRFAGFLAEGISGGDAVVLACTRDGHGALADALQSHRIARNDRRLPRVDVLPDIAATAASIAQSVRAACRARKLRTRLLADFGQTAGPETIFEIEGLLSSALRGLNVVSITQYHGRTFAASATLEQFHTHALAIVGNAICKENRNYIPPEHYLRKFAAKA
ncbi:MAG: hypothetical protein JO187_08680 [Acidobacteria bacterium]|nr:hypothetical protein [Acidobacteriota bacterium]